MLEDWIDKHLAKQGFIRTPMSWSKDYQELAIKHQNLHKMVRDLAREYDNALVELAECKGEDYIISELKEIQIDPGDKKGQELIDLYINTFGVNFDDDVEEVIQ